METVVKKQKSLLKALKVSGPYVISIVNWMPIFMAGLVVKNRHPKDTCHDEIQVCAQNIDTILGSVVHITIRRIYVTTLNTKRFFTVAIFVIHHNC